MGVGDPTALERRLELRKPENEREEQSRYVEDKLASNPTRAQGNTEGLNKSELKFIL